MKAEEHANDARQAKVASASHIDARRKAEEEARVSAGVFVVLWWLFLISCGGGGGCF
jgi:hypothetical protein